MRETMETAFKYFVYELECGNDSVLSHVFEAVEYLDEDIHDKDDPVVIYFKMIIQHLKTVRSINWKGVAVFTLVDNEDFELKLI